MRGSGFPAYSGLPELVKQAAPPGPPGIWGKLRDAWGFVRGGVTGEASALDVLKPLVWPAIILLTAAPIVGGLLAGQQLGEFLGTYEETPDRLLRWELADEYRRQIARLRQVRESRREREKEEGPRLFL